MQVIGESPDADGPRFIGARVSILCPVTLECDVHVPPSREELRALCDAHVEPAKIKSALEALT